MSEIVERLRAADPFYLPDYPAPNYEPVMIEPSALRLEAAAEIERLEAEVARLEREKIMFNDLIQSRAEAAESRALALQGERDEAVKRLGEAVDLLKRVPYVGMSIKETADVQWPTSIHSGYVRRIDAFLATLDGDYSAKSPAISTNNEQKEADCVKR